MAQLIIHEGEDGGVVVVFPTGETTMEYIIANDIPQGIPYAVIEDTDIPADRTFREAWAATNLDSEDPSLVVEDYDISLEVAHELRRKARSAEFAPHDEVIMKQIPGNDMVAAEEARATIRAKYDGIQADLDATPDVDSIKTVLSNNSIFREL